MIYAENIMVCIAVPLLLSLLFVRGNVRRFTGSFLLGMGVCLLAAYISGFLSLVGGLSAEDTAVFISPVVEEMMKFLPLLFFLYLFQPEDDSFTMTALGIGAGFATFENCCYLLSSGAESLTFVLIRGMVVGVMHIVSILALSLGIVMARRYRALTFPGLVGALSLSSTFHALYNLLVSAPGVTTVIGYILPILTAGILYLPFQRLRFFHTGADGPSGDL